jgi:tetratricopeptide (TPR) repeat protein
MSCEPLVAPPPRRDAWIVLAVALGVRLAYLALLASDPVLSALRGVDSNSYLAHADEIAAGGWAKVAVFHSGVLYPWFLAAVGRAPLVAVSIQLALDAASALLTWRLAARFGRAAALAAGLLYATAAVPVFTAGTLLFESIGVFLMLGALVVFGAALERPAPARWALATFVLALAASARPYLLATPALLLGGLAARRAVTWPSVARLAAASAAGAALVLVPIALQNRAATGELRAFPASSGFALYLGNNPRADGTLRIPPELGIAGGDTFTRAAIDHPSRRSGRALTPSEASAWWRREALAFWRDEPTRAFALTLRKAALLLHAAELPDNYDLTLFRERNLLLRVLPDWLPVLLLAPWGVVVALRRRRGGLVVAMLGLHAAVMPLLLVSGRVRFGLAALLCVFAGAALGDLLDAARAADRRRLLAAAPVLAAAAALALWPLGSGARGPDPVALGQVAAILISNDRPAEALATLERANIASAPSSFLHITRARALAQLGRTTEAVAEARRAISIDRREDEAHLVLEAISAVSPGPAERDLLAVAARDPGPASALALARGYVEAQRYDAAVSWAKVAAGAGGGDEARFVLAVALDGRGRSGESAAILQELLARNAPTAPLLAQLGYALLDDQRIDAAAERFEEALRLDPGHAPALWGLAIVESQRGQLEPAKASLRAFLARVPPGSDWAQRAEERLRQLEGR